MKKTAKILLLLIVLIGIGGVSGYFWLMKSSGRDVETETSAYTVSEKVLTAAFRSDAASAQKKFIEKAISVSGTVSNVNGTEIILGQNIVCNFSKKVAVTTNESIIVKGRVVGYDDLMEEIRLDQCTLETQNQ